MFRATAAIRQIEAEMHGNAFSYKGASSYEDAMKAIDEMEKAGKPIHGLDPNKKALAVKLPVILNLFNRIYYKSFKDWT